MSIYKGRKKESLSVKETVVALEELSLELGSCRKCGKCQSVCPVFAKTGLEQHTSRGKISLLQGLERKVLFNIDKIDESLKFCLLCGKCSKACPVGIDTKLLFLRARLILNDFRKKSFLKKILIRFFIAFPKFKVLLSKRKKESKKLNTAARGNVVFYSGCLFDQFFNDKTEKAVKIIERLGYNVSVVSGECCGIPFISSGDIKKYYKSRKSLYEKIISKNPEFIVSGCPTCITTIKDLWKGLSAGLPYPENVKIVEFGQFLYSNIKDLQNSDKTLRSEKIKWHTPCHLKSLGAEAESLWLMEKFSGNKIDDDYKKDECCGFGGTFSMDHPVLSKSLLEKRAESLNLKKGELLVTGCPACMLQLGRASGIEKNRIVHAIDFVWTGIDMIPENQEV